MAHMKIQNGTMRFRSQLQFGEWKGSPLQPLRWARVLLTLKKLNPHLLPRGPIAAMANQPRARLERAGRFCSPESADDDNSTSDSMLVTSPHFPYEGRRRPPENPDNITTKVAHSIPQPISTAYEKNRKGEPTYADNLTPHSKRAKLKAVLKDNRYQIHGLFKDKFGVALSEEQTTDLLKTLEKSLWQEKLSWADHVIPTDVLKLVEERRKRSRLKSRRLRSPYTIRCQKLRRSNAKISVE